MNYWAITKDDMNNGAGLRVVLWVAGCTHHCKGCHNAYTWNENGGNLFDNQAIIELFRELDKDYIKGITFSGGDPLHPHNRNCIGRFCEIIKGIWDKKDIWIYTGYQWEEIKHLPFIKYVDVICDGEFKEKLADVNCHWVGSTNQRVIDVKSSLSTGEVVLYE